MSRTVSSLFTVDGLVEAATHETGLDDFGLWAWRDGLEALLDAAERDGDLNEIGVGVLRRRKRWRSSCPSTRRSRPRAGC